MPGSSLWLLPDPESTLYKVLATLINASIPAVYPIAIPPQFSPHITLTADTVTASIDEPQEWLDGLALPESVAGLTVAIKEAQIGRIFFQKLTLRVEKSAALKELAARSRLAGTGFSEAEVREWVDGVYGPHLSLMYSDLPQEEIASKLEDVRAVIERAKEGDEQALTAKGAEIWLVPTEKDIEDWKPVARRKLKEVEWSWES